MPPDPTDAPAVPRLLVANLLASIGFGLVAMTVCLPSMPSWAGAFDVPQASVQLTFSGFVIAFGLAQVLYGPLSDRYGRRRVLLVGFALAAAGSLAAALAQTLPALVAARIAQGAGASAGMVIGRAMVQDLFSGADRPRVMAYIGMTMGLCPPIATVVGGQLHEFLGWRACFVLAAVLAVTLFVTNAWLVPGGRHRPRGEAHWLAEMLRAYATLARVPAYRAYVGILGMSTGAFYVFLAGLPVVLARMGVGAGDVGFYLMLVPLAYILGNFLTSRLVRRTSEPRLMALGQGIAIAGIGVALALALGGVAAPLAVALPLTLLGVGHGLLMPSTLAGTVGVLPALAGAAAGAAGLAQQLFGAFGGYAVGLVGHDTAVNLALLLLVFTLLSSASLAALARTRPGAGAESR